MALSSPRFASNGRLQAASQNNPPMNWGEVGQAVRLVQQALLDLDFDMPITTQRFGSPDGIFGDETKGNVLAFQSQNGLFADGVVGQGTLAKLDQLLPDAGDPLTPIPASIWVRQKFRMTFRSGALPQIPEDVALANARLVYGQYGFQVNEGAGMSILIAADEQVQLDASPTECKLNQEDDLQKLLFSLGGGRQGVEPTDVLIFYVNKLTTTQNQQLNGCASHRPGAPAVAVAAGASPWSCAHEVGHCLLGNLTPTHDTRKWNLMFFSTNQLTAALPGLSEVQVRQLRKSPLVSRV